MRARFRLREAIIAIPALRQSLTIITVPRDVVLEVVGEPQKSGLVEVLWDGRPIAVFVRDIESRGEAIEVSSAGA
jgi:hypothetical protein